jgi:hypothetical protein
VAFIPKGYHGLTSKPDGRKERFCVGKDYDYSKTTIYYVGKFLGLRLPDIRKGIENGQIVFDEALCVPGRGYENV